MGHGAPSWVYQQRQAISDASHDSTERRLQDRINELKKENADLKERIEKLQNAFLIAMDLALKP
jgi:cell division protein FtsB